MSEYKPKFCVSYRKEYMPIFKHLGEWQCYWRAHLKSPPFEPTAQQLANYLRMLADEIEKRGIEGVVNFFYHRELVEAPDENSMNYEDTGERELCLNYRYQDR